MKLYLTSLAFILVVLAAGLTGAYLDAYSDHYAHIRAMRACATNDPTWVVRSEGTNIVVAFPLGIELGLSHDGYLVWRQIGTVEGWRR
jgi:hypothetical protein